LVFLDILFGPPKGIVVGHKIREDLQNENIHIVYISGAEQYAMKLFKSRPFDFLIKPFGKEEVMKVIEKSMDLTDLYNQSFEFQYDKVRYSILYSEIIYFESKARKVLIHTANEVYEFYGKINNVQQDVNGKFYRVHQSYMINPTYVQQFLYDKVIMRNGTVISISKNYRNGIRKLLLNEWSK
jgi:DNA-binding LytR/AlgR family response regulator